MPRPLRLGVLAVAACICLVLPGSGTAAVLTLTAEHFQSSPPLSTATVECATTPGGVSTMTYDVAGTATGPYTGTFTETGQVSFTDTAIVSFSAHFTINSPAGTVVGDKFIDPNAPAPTTMCGPVDDIPEFGQVLFSERYSASITGSPSGDFTESGTSAISLSVTEDALGDTAVSMGQDFISGGPPGTTITLTPATAINPTGTNHTVTAVVRDALGEPVQGVQVIFTIQPGNNTALCVGTDANGVCSLTYAGPDFPRADEITACIDGNANSQTDPGETCAVASKVWTAGATTEGHVSGGGYIKGAGMSFAVGARAQTLTEPPHGHCNANDHEAHIKIRCDEITSMIVTPTHATIFATGEQDGVATNIRIDVDDLSDSGLPDTFQITTDLGYTNGGPLTGGNIQIRF